MNIGGIGGESRSSRFRQLVLVVYPASIPSSGDRRTELMLVWLQGAWRTTIVHPNQVIRWMSQVYQNRLGEMQLIAES
jgi:hypothetical protein